MEIELSSNWRVKVLRFFVWLSALLSLAHSSEVLLPAVSSNDDLTLGTAYPLTSSEYTWDDDEDWWKDVEEIDLTLPLGDIDDEECIEEDFLISNESIFWDIDCDDFVKMPSPPNWIESLPPPPLPFFLRELEEHLQESIRRWNNKNTIAFHGIEDLFEQNEEEEEEREEEDNLSRRTRISKWISFEDQKCSVCEWAKGGNETLDIFSKERTSNKHRSLSNGMIGVLIGVAFFSAVIGAILMILLLRCRKNKIFTCWAKKSTHRVQSEAVGKTSTEVNKSKTQEETRWSLKLWRKSLSQSPLHPNSSSGYENSYSEEPYVNADVSCAVYAELNCPTKSPHSPNHAVSLASNSYSEIPDPVRPTELNICSRLYSGEGTYENAGYIITEAHSDPTESSTTGSTSTPSSAYYSDVSSCEIQQNKKKKKKRKGDERFIIKFAQPLTEGVPTTSLPIISNRVTIRPLPLNVISIHSQGIPEKELVSLPLHVIPSQRSSSVNHYRAFEVGVPEMHRRSQNNLVRTTAVPSTRYHLDNSNFADTNQLNILNPQNLNSCSYFETICPEVLMSRQCSSDSFSVQRPLPPLPNKQVDVPQGRSLKSKLEQRLSGVPSEYV